MIPLQPNPQTGYLESLNHHNSFDSNKKAKFLQMARESLDNKQWPPVFELCKALGVSVRAFNLHLHKDPKFAEDWNEIKASLQSIFTCELATKAVSKMGVIANLAVLKYLENGTWNEKGQLIHITDSARENRVNNHFSDAIDAEIIDNPQITSTQPNDTGKH